MTDAERKLWNRLRNRQLDSLKFRRQHSFGPYIVDFYCPLKHLIIEVDGGQHYKPKGQLYDKTRDKYLKTLGLKILRYSNRDVLLNIDVVLQDVLNAVKHL